MKWIVILLLLGLAIWAYLKWKKIKEFIPFL